MALSLEGYEALARALTREADLGAQVIGDSGAKEALKKSLNLIRDDAKGRVHRRSGNLQGAIQSRVEMGADRETLAEVGVNYKRSAKGHHAHLVEYGHKGPHPAPPHPFWAPAVEAKEKAAMQALEDQVSAVAERIWGEDA